MLRVIPFPNTTNTVRCVELQGKLYASALDYVQVYSHDPDKPSREKARACAYKILQGFNLSEWSRHHQFEGSGQQRKQVVTLEGLLHMNNRLPSYRGKEYSDKVVQVLTSCLTGKAPLVEVPVPPRKQMRHVGPVRVSEDKLLSTVDVVAFVMPTNSHQAAKKVRMMDLRCTERNATGGGKLTKLLSYKDALQLIEDLGRPKEPFVQLMAPLFAAEPVAGPSATVVAEPSLVPATPVEMQVVSFDELKLGTTVRILKEKPPLIHAIDLAMVVTGSDNHNAAQSIRRIKPDVFDIRNKMILRNVRLSCGFRDVKFVNYEDALQLVMALGGEGAKIMKIQFANILTRYFAGDTTMHAEIEANAASSAPINALARQALGSKRPRSPSGELEDVRQALHEVVEVSQALGTTMAQQKADAVFMLDVFEKMLEVQKKASEAQYVTEKAKQETFAIEMKTAEGKAQVELGLKEKLAQIVAAERQDELSFLEKKQKLIAPHTPQVAKPKTVRDIAQEEDYWQQLTTTLREELLTRAGAMARAQQVLPMPAKVPELNSHGTLWEVNAYDSHQHSALRLLLQQAKANLLHKKMATQGQGRLDSFLVTFAPQAQE